MANKHCVAAIVFEKNIARVTYNYGFVPVPAPAEGGEESETYKSVSYNGLPSSNGIKKAVLEAEFPVATEQKLINEYNAGVMKMIPRDEAEIAKEKYKAFLEKRKDLFEQIEEDCKEYGIK